MTAFTQGVGRQYAEDTSPSVAVFIGFAAQVKPVRFESAGASALHALPFSPNPGDATGTQGIGI